MSRHHSAGASCPREAGLMSQRGRSVQLLRRKVGVAASVSRASGLAVLCLSLQVVLKEATGKNQTVSSTTAKWKNTQVHYIEERALGISRISF